MAFDVNTFVIDRIMRAVMTQTADGSYLFGINQISNPTLSVTTEQTQAVDALGTPIMTFDRAKQAEFSAENSLFDLNLLAAQQGVEKEVASATHKIVVPAFDTYEVGDETTIILNHTPIDDITEIFVLNGDDTLGTRYTANTEATADKFVYADGVITLPTGVTKGTQLFVMYEYESEEAVAVTADAVNFGKSGKFVMEVLGSDVCDPTTLIHAYVIFPNAKLNADVDITFETEGTHPFTIVAQQAYCDHQKTLFKVVIPKED